ncbi:MAG: hypothetical protein KJ000_24990 [Pirellulaceae bacterium]|nr:hypothetical protein [Pirellulaceae bacterium]
MIETERTERRIIQQAFGGAAQLVETGPAPGHPGRVEIWRGGGLLGSGTTFARALADSLAFTLPGVVRAIELEVLL